MTVRSAASIIVSSTLVVALASGLLVRVLDQKEYKNIFIGMWGAIQSVTTVGYGDVTPKGVGRPDRRRSRDARGNRPRRDRRHPVPRMCAIANAVPVVGNGNASGG